LISDGENFGDDLEGVVSELADSGVKVFSLGIGTEQGSEIPRGNGVVIDPETGKAAVSKLESQSLRLTSSETGGEYFEISDASQQSGDLISALDRLEGGVANTRKVEASSNKYFYFLLAALGLALLDMILPIKTIKL
jgi:Ca-activated chloride channel family protein